MQGIKCWDLPSTNSDRSFKEGESLLPQTRRASTGGSGTYQPHSCADKQNRGEIRRSRDSMTLKNNRPLKNPKMLVCHDFLFLMVSLTISIHFSSFTIQSSPIWPSFSIFEKLCHFLSITRDAQYSAVGFSRLYRFLVCLGIPVVIGTTLKKRHKKQN